jgi:hypothetical protein
VDEIRHIRVDTTAIEGAMSSDAKSRVDACGRMMSGRPYVLTSRGRPDGPDRRRRSEQR